MLIIGKMFKFGTNVFLLPKVFHQIKFSSRWKLYLEGKKNDETKYWADKYCKRITKTSWQRRKKQKQINIIHANTEHQELVMNKDPTILIFTDAHIILIYMLEHYPLW